MGTMVDRHNIQIRLSGTGGQGLILAGRMLAQALVIEGSRVAQSQSYEPTSRGGVSRADLVVSQSEVDYPLVTDLDYLLVLDQSALNISEGLINPGAVVLVNTTLVPQPHSGDFSVQALPLTDVARSLRNPRVTNVVSLGALVALGDFCKFESLEKAVAQMAPKKFNKLNLEALRSGRNLVEQQSRLIPTS